MAASCLARFPILAGGLVVLYELDWYSKNRKQNRKLARNVEEEVEDYNVKEPLDGRRIVYRYIFKH